MIDQPTLEALWRSKTWPVLRALAKEMSERWFREQPVGDQWEYLKSSLERDGKLLGVGQFLEEIEKRANRP